MLHPLAVEDALRAHQRPKLDIFDASVFIVCKTVRFHAATETIERGEVHLFAGDGFVVTVRHGRHSALDGVRRNLERTPSLLRQGPGAVLYAVIDHIVDEYQLAMDDIEQVIDQIEEQVFSSQANAAERIFRLKRQVLEFHRWAVLMGDVLDPLVRQLVPPAVRHEDLPEYFRDVLDHVIRVSGRIETARDLLGAALEANLAQVTVRQNDDMRAISGWAAVIGVPTLIAGVWGMNFEHMPELGWTVGYPLALGTIIGSALLVRWRLKRNGWL